MSGAPYGGVYKNKQNIGSVFKLKVNVNKRFKLDVKLGGNHEQREFTDTSTCVYNWYGECVTRIEGRSEIANSNSSRLYVWATSFYARMLMKYELSEHFSLTMNIAPTYNLRTGDEKLSGTWDPATSKGQLFSLVNGGELQWKPDNKKVEATAFVKHYLQQGAAEEPLPGGLGANESRIATNNLGFGGVLSYQIAKNIRVKPSYEYAIRLPMSDEYFGDGAFISDNHELKPEQSSNLNLQTSWFLRRGVSLKSNLFARVVDNLILLIPNDDRSSLYDNVYGASSYGIELGAQLKKLNEQLIINANSTYQYFTNTSSEGHFSRFYGDRIPNTPYLFVNGTIGYQPEKILKGKQRLKLFYSMRYTHNYFLTWESLGSISSKRSIASQTIQGAGLVYAWNKYTPVAVSAEVQNIFNVSAYDFYGVQKPGRAFYIKIATSF